MEQLEVELNTLSEQLMLKNNKQEELISHRDRMMSDEAKYPRDGEEFKTADQIATAAVQEWLDLWGIVISKRLELTKYQRFGAIKYSCSIFSGRVVDVTLLTRKDKPVVLLDLYDRNRKFSDQHKNKLLMRIRDRITTNNTMTGYDALSEIVDIFDVWTSPECKDQVLAPCHGLEVA